MTRRYNQGQIINVKVALTAAHRGFFQFRIAPLVDGRVVGDSQGKLRGYLLRTVSLLFIQNKIVAYETYGYVPPLRETFINFRSFELLKSVVR